MTFMTCHASLSGSGCQTFLVACSELKVSYRHVEPQCKARIAGHKSMETPVERVPLMELPQALMEKVVARALGGTSELQQVCRGTSRCYEPLPLAKQTEVAPAALMKR
jgi:hypothetical protein